MMTEFIVQLRAELFGFLRLSLFYDVTQRWLIVTDVSAQPIGPIFKGQAVKEEFWIAWPLKIGTIGCPETSVAIYQSILHGRSLKVRISNFFIRNTKLQVALNQLTLWTFRIVWCVEIDVIRAQAVPPSSGLLLKYNVHTKSLLVVQTILFWVTTPCTAISFFRRFGGTFCPCNLINDKQYVPKSRPGWRVRIVTGMLMLRGGTVYKVRE
jgi:hypothetical protein